MKKILIVEDDPAILKLYSIELINEGYDVYQTSSGEEALEKLTSDKNFNLILLDIMLGGDTRMDGFDLLEQIKKDEHLSKIPVVVVTNMDGQEGIARNIGVADFILKYQTTPKDVVERIKKHI